LLIDDNVLFSSNRNCAGKNAALQVSETGSRKRSVKTAASDTQTHSSRCNGGVQATSLADESDVFSLNLNTIARKTFTRS